jgi:hypothetical protein
MPTDPEKVRLWGKTGSGLSMYPDCSDRDVDWSRCGARRFKGREVGREVLEFVDRICPIFLACLPKRAQALFMRDRVLDNDGADTLWVAERHAKPDRPTIILHEQNVVRDGSLMLTPQRSSSSRAAWMSETIRCSPFTEPGAAVVTFLPKMPLRADIAQCSRHVRFVPTAVRETEALWRALINLVPEPADAPERQSFELLRNDCPCEQRD